jgi:hypothetical protein
MRAAILSLSLVLAAASSLSTSSATAAGPYRIRVTCTVPKGQPERQLAPNACLNYVPDGTQTYIARVVNGAGRPMAGVSVRWTDTDIKDANFRIPQNPCKTSASGQCSAEVRDTKPRPGEKLTITATAGGSSANGFLTFK